MSDHNQTSSQPHPVIAILAIGFMALCLAAGMVFLGLMGKIDLFLESLILPAGLAAPTQSLPISVSWAYAVCVAFLLPCIVLHIAGLWRRMVILIASTATTFAWGPVLLLSSYRPELGISLIAVLWSGVCAVVYTLSHDTPAEKISPSIPDKEYGAS